MYFNRRTMAILAIIFTVIVLAFACALIIETHVDYQSAEALEKDINAGENVIGKTAKIDILNVVDDAYIGIFPVGTNYWAGDHLNFVSTHRYVFEKGDTIRIKVVDVLSVGEHIFVEYELAD